MCNDVKLIVEAINNLQQPVDIFKDYLYPVFSAILSSALALVVAYISLHYQERIANEKRKAEEINKWLFIAYEAFQCLIDIKNNYSGKLNSNPIERAVTIPPILSINHDNIKINDSHKLAFLVPNKSESDKVGIQKWGKINVISAMISNYNMVLNIWRTRNDLMISVRDIMLDGISEGYKLIEHSKLRSEIGDQKLLQLVDFTEKAIIYTDDLIVELYDFLVNFPVYAESRINYRLIKNYQNIVMIDHTEYLHILKIIKKSPDADYSSVVDLYGMNLETLKIMYSRLYK